MNLTIKSLANQLKEYDPNILVYVGETLTGAPDDRYTLSEIHNPIFFNKIYSCRSALPSSRSIKENVLILVDFDKNSSISITVGHLLSILDGLPLDSLIFIGENYTYDNLPTYGLYDLEPKLVYFDQVKKYANRHHSKFTILKNILIIERDN